MTLMPGVSTRRRRRVLAAVGVGAVVAAGTVALVGASAARAPAPEPAAIAYLPTDGRATWMSSEAGAEQWEHWVSTGVPAFFAFPETARNLALPGYSIAEFTGRHWAVLRTKIGEPVTTAQRGMDLYAVTDAGIRLTVNLDAETGFTFTPGVLVLGAAARPGATWTTEGEAVYALGDDASASFEFQGEYSAREPSDAELVPFTRDGCLEVDGSLTFTEQGATATFLVIHDASLWCPGEGVVAAATSTDDDPARSVTSVVDTPALRALAASDPRGADATTWRLEPAEVVYPHAAYGPTTRLLSPAVEPVAVGDTLVVALTAGSGLAFVREIDGEFHEVRLAQPGGEPTAMGAVDDLVVVVTSDRSAVAYRADGIRVWQAELGDTAVAPPVRGADGSVLIATMDGGIRALAPRDGSVLWRTDTTPDAVAYLRADGDRVIAVDRAGGATALSARDGKTLWTTSGAAPDTATAAAGSVYIARDNAIECLDAATGTLTWRARIGTGADDLAVVGTDLVVLSWGDLFAFNTGSGEQVWSAPGAEHLSVVGDAVLVDGGGPPRLLGADGEELVRWDAVPSESSAAARFLAVDDYGAWIVDSVDGLFRIAP